MSYMPAVTSSSTIGLSSDHYERPQHTPSVSPIPFPTSSSAYDLLKFQSDMNSTTKNDIVNTDGSRMCLLHHTLLKGSPRRPEWRGPATDSFHAAFGDDWIPVLTDEESRESCGMMNVEMLCSRLRSLGVLLQEGNGDNKEAGRNLEPFIRGDHQFGVAYAWACQFYYRRVAPCEQRQKVNIDNLMSLSNFDGLLLTYISAPSVSSPSLIKTDSVGNQFINHPHSIRPRRFWDLCSNQVIPREWTHTCRRWRREDTEYVAISHSWTTDMEPIWTHVNRYEWPVPLPKGVFLEDIRRQLLDLGVRYAWLDVLCLRQPMFVPGMSSGTQRAPLICPRDDLLSADIMAEKEIIRLDEWKVDIPTIGNIYLHSIRTVYYLNGIGRPFDPSLVELKWNKNICRYELSSPEERHWLNRAWTLQEMVGPNKMILGTTIKQQHREYFKDTIEEPLIRFIRSFGVPSHMELLTLLLIERRKCDMGINLDLDDQPRVRNVYLSAISEITRRHATSDVDKVAGLMCLFLNGRDVPLPVYSPTESQSSAWVRAVSATADFESRGSIPLCYAKTLLSAFPHPSARYWFPSWEQVKKYPDVSLLEIQEPDPKPEDVVETPFLLDSAGFVRNCKVTRICAAHEGQEDKFHYLIHPEHGPDLEAWCYKRNFPIPVQEGTYVVLLMLIQGETSHFFPTQDYGWLVLCRELGRSTSGQSNGAPPAVHLRKIATVQCEDDVEPWLMADSAGRAVTSPPPVPLTKGKEVRIFLH
ncbi:hypothetical protein BDZ91DRAFT_851808 [Kalaharituber pfeilii]|nr:hypothetical protein BDZ91DRAFT_851808 [Kalaharituber pfeilii]